MSEPRWTPGPWDYRPGGFDDWGWIRGGPGGLTVGHAHGSLDDDEANRHRAAKTDPWEANARLMAAAPELYDALIAMISMKPHEWECECLACSLARRAVAKARGEQ